MSPCLIGGETGRNVHLRGGVPCPGMTLNSTLEQFTCYFFIGRMLFLGLNALSVADKFRIPQGVPQ